MRFKYTIATVFNLKVKLEESLYSRYGAEAPAQETPVPQPISCLQNPAPELGFAVLAAHQLGQILPSVCPREAALRQSGDTAEVPLADAR